MRHFVLTPEDQDGNGIDAVFWDDSTTIRLTLSDAQPVVTSPAFDGPFVLVQSLQLLHIVQAETPVATDGSRLHLPGGEPYAHIPGHRFSFRRHASVSGTVDVYLTNVRKAG